MARVARGVHPPLLVGIPRGAVHAGGGQVPTVLLRAVELVGGAHAGCLLCGDQSGSGAEQRGR